MSQKPLLFLEDWSDVVRSIADDLDASAKAHRALQRRRGIQSGATLLRLILTYALVLSLRLTAVWGVGLELWDISRQAIEKRVLKSTAWLRYLVAVMLRHIVERPPAPFGAIERVVIRDASVIARPGSCGVEWRVHLTWQPFVLQPVALSLSDASCGESLSQAELQAGDLLLGDRCYGTWRKVEVVLEALAYLIVRTTWSNLPLCTEDGQPFDMCAWLRRLPQEQTIAEVAVYAADDPQRRPLRLIAGRLPAAAAEKARQKVEQQAKRKNRSVHPNSVLAAGFCLLLTNLPAADWAAWTILDWYRLRWQVEWCFRRWKSLCGLDRLPAYPSAIAEAVLLAKLLLILLMQQRVGALPWPEWWSDPSQPAPLVSTIVQAGYAQLCEIIRPTSFVNRLLAEPTRWMRHLRDGRRKRLPQVMKVIQQFRNPHACRSPA